MVRIFDASVCFVHDNVYSDVITETHCESYSCLKTVQYKTYFAVCTSLLQLNECNSNVPLLVNKV